MGSLEAYIYYIQLQQLSPSLPKVKNYHGMFILFQPHFQAYLSNLWICWQNDNTYLNTDLFSKYSLRCVKDKSGLPV